MQVKTSILLTLLYILTLNHLVITHGVNEEGYFLQNVKLSLSGPTGFLADWSDRDATPCNWTGISCDGRGSVVSVNLSNLNVFGFFPIMLCRLPSLSELSLSNNSLNHSLPLSISSCRSLTYLDLSQNYFGGPLPPTLSQLRFLRYLNLGQNNFAGEIPATFGNFQQLESLILVSNYLNGTIPSALGNITTLKKLHLAFNTFSSALPPELGNLMNLEEMWLTTCDLVGTIPVSYGQLTKLVNFDVCVNRLSGSIPSSIFHMKSIVQMVLYSNSFSGSLPPVGWSNLTNLRRFDASTNQLTGFIPNDLCALPLESLNLFENQFEGSIPEIIAKSPNLSELKLFTNRLTGSLPGELGKNSALVYLDVCSNNLSGEIPQYLCEKGALEILILYNNSLSGNIPERLGKCMSVARIRMHNNRFEGDVPAEFWGLPNVYHLELSDNNFSGNISSLICGTNNLSSLLISSNKFTGSLPSEIGSLDTLVKFSADNNKLTGEIPSSIVNLGNLSTLNLSNNQLSGRIPEGIESIKQLNDLNLANNLFSGEIPDEIGNLPVLNYLDLSQNRFSGHIPLSFEKLVLNRLNLSNNHLSGEIPSFLAKEFNRDSFLGNPDLCMNFSGSCKIIVGKRNRIYSWTLNSIFVLAAIASIVGVYWLVRKFKKIKKMKKEVTLVKWTSFHKLGFSEFEIMDSLKESNVIGRGASGKVYKVVLSNGEIVAVKKLYEKSHIDKNCVDTESNEKFDAEVETLGKIRHKNIVRLWCCCKTGYCKLLVYEYMPNGSLGDLLHGEKGLFLDWPKRFKIAVDSAEGLSYLHHDSVTPIVHRDVKSNNILLDEDFRAKISDFGVAKVIKLVKKRAETMSVIAGSCGYIAPEYAYTLRVNEKSDVYSFGIVILELVTGKPPIGPEFEDKDFAMWVRTTFDQKGINQVMDSKLDAVFKQHIFRVLEIGLLCTSSLPVNRPSMRVVVKMLQELGASMPSVAEKDAKLLP